MQKPTLKKLARQTIVITGASSGIGLATARLAAEAGARVVLIARNRTALKQIEKELLLRGAAALAIVADVGRLDQLQSAAQDAIAHFGHIDTWVNNAGVSIFGKLEEVPLEEQRKLFDTNFWGTVHGSLTALSLLRDGGGALINVGSELSDVAAPLQGMYSASKHAVRGFTDALRLEIEHDRLPVSVTLIKPAAIDTMYVEHAKNYMDTEPRLPAPLYAPEAVAEAILSAAEHPKRDIFVGSAAAAMSTIGRLAPALADRVLRRLFDSQRSQQPPHARSQNSLDAPQRDGRVRSGQTGKRARELSVYTQMTTRAASGARTRKARRSDERAQTARSP